VSTLSVLFAINNSNVPIVRTVCDYGFICPNATMIKPNGINCYENFGINCVRNKCVSFRWYMMHVFEKKIRSYMNRKVFNMYLPFNLNLKKTLEKTETQLIIYLPLFTEIKNNNRQEIKIDVEKNAILYVGAINKYKGVEYLLKSLPIVKTRIPKVKLFIVGTGKNEKPLRLLCKELNIEKNVFFMGKVTDNELISFYKKTEILVVPSVWQEMFGLVGIEALSYGKPVVGSNIGGIPEWLENGKNGFLVEPRNHIEMAEKILVLLENKNLSRKMGEYGKKTLEKKFSKQRHIEKLESIYTNLVKNNDKK
jgi:glycosyltransferase involved in cell wall biosynthesis